MTCQAWTFVLVVHHHHHNNVSNYCDQHTAKLAIAGFPIVTPVDRAALEWVPFAVKEWTTQSNKKFQHLLIAMQSRHCCGNGRQMLSAESSIARLSDLSGKPRNVLSTMLG